MGIMNLDIQNVDELRVKMYEAVKDGDDNAQKEAFQNYFKAVEQAVIAEADKKVSEMGDSYDTRILVERGTLKALTSEERTYFNEVITHNGFNGIEKMFPKTTMNEIFKNLTTEHPILSLIDTMPSEIVGELLLSNPTKAKAFWGKLCDPIKQMILEGFRVVDYKASKLSGFVPVCKAMLSHGPEWLATYVITIMREIMAVSLEEAVIAGTGKEQPIGMTKKLSGAVDNVYPDKALITMADFKPETLAGIRATMAAEKTDNGEVVVLVNPETYWAKIFSNLIYRRPDGSYINDVLPTGERIVQSHAMPKDRLVFGVMKNYLLGMVMDVELKKYTETLAIEDLDLYIAKIYAYGQAKDKNAFFVADISTIAGATPVAAEPAGI